MTTTLPRPLSSALSAGFGSPLESAQSATGGHINRAAHVRFAGHSYFVKWNPSAPEGFFEAEAKGLEILRETATIHAPKALVWQETDRATGCPAFLLLEHITPPTISIARDGFAKLFAEHLYALHTSAREAATYGLECDNFIGLLPQDNTPHDNWVTFWQDCRIQPQLDLARATGALRSHHIAAVESLCTRIPQWLPKSPARALLHGDLWSGNYLIYQDGSPTLIDPAVYRGHYEVDLAMMDLFGGFPHAIHDIYQTLVGHEEGWRERKRVYQAYYLLVHVNLFGGSYPKQLIQLIKPIL